MDTTTGTVTAITAKILIGECTRRGISRQELLHEIGISDELLASPSGRIPIAKMLILWECIAKYIKDPMLPFHAAVGVPFGAYRVLDYMFAASETPREGLLRSSRYFSLVNNAFVFTLRVRAACVYLELHNACPLAQLPWGYAEYILMNYLVRLRFVTQTDIKPSEVWLNGRSRSHAKESERGFNAPVRSGQPVNCLVLPRHLMELRQALADPELCEMLEEHANRRLHDFSVSSEPLAYIYQALAHNLRSGKLTLNFLASQLAKSPRNLQREIHEHGSTFREILTRVRQDHAMSLLNQTDLPVKEIARKLRFATATAFCHAFQRWTGVSAGDYRRRFQPSTLH